MASGAGAARRRMVLGRQVLCSVATGARSSFVRSVGMYRTRPPSSCCSHRLHYYPLRHASSTPTSSSSERAGTTTAAASGAVPSAIDPDAVSKEIWTIPNMITMSRIVASPALTYAIACDMKGWALGGCVLFGFTDWLDGFIAKRYNMRSVLGAFLDPLADKIFIGALALGLTVKGVFPLSLACVILGRDVVLVVGSFVIRARERPPGAPFFDTTSSATFQIVPSDFSKANTGCQIAVLALTMGHFAVGAPSMAVIEPLYWITAVTTVSSGLLYLDGTGIKRLGKSGEYRPTGSKEA